MRIPRATGQRFHEDLDSDSRLAAFTDVARRGLLEIFDDRHELRSTLVTSQLPRGALAR